MACVTACPSGVQYDSLLEAARPQVERDAKRGVGDRAFRRLIFAMFPHPGRLRALSCAARPVSEARHPAARAFVGRPRAAAEAAAGDGAPVAADHFWRRRSAGADSGSGHAAQARGAAARVRAARVFRQCQRSHRPRARGRRLRSDRSAGAGVLRSAGGTRRRRSRCHGGREKAHRRIRRRRRRYDRHQRRRLRVCDEAVRAPASQRSGVRANAQRRSPRNARTFPKSWRSSSRARRGAPCS